MTTGYADLARRARTGHRPAALAVAVALLAGCGGTDDTAAPADDVFSHDGSTVLADLDLGDEGKVRFIENGTAGTVVVAAVVPESDRGAAVSQQVAAIDLNDLAGSYRRLARAEDPATVQRLQKAQERLGKGRATAAAAIPTATAHKVDSGTGTAMTLQFFREFWCPGGSVERGNPGNITSTCQGPVLGGEGSQVNASDLYSVTYVTQLTTGSGGFTNDLYHSRCSTVEFLVGCLGPYSHDRVLRLNVGAGQFGLIVSSGGEASLRTSNAILPGSSSQRFIVATLKQRSAP